MKYEIDSQLTPKQYSIYIQSHIEEDKSEKYRKWNQNPDGKMYGHVTESSFWLVPKTDWRSFFAPVFKGEFNGKETTHVYIQVESSPAVKSFLFVFLFIYFIYVIVSAFCDASFLKNQSDWISIIVPPLAESGVLAFDHHNKFNTMNQYKPFFLGRD